MSRVVYANTPTTVAQEALREANGVRIVSNEEEGSGVNALPGGVYGFTYSPGIASAPLFAERRYRSYETHKLASGEVLVIGFVSVDTVQQIESAVADVSVNVQPQPEEGYETLVAIPYSRIRHHRQYAAPNQHAFSATVTPAVEHV
jgi:hypothetical protein